MTNKTKSGVSLKSGHEFYIRRTLELARKGIGYTKTNPMVGAVLVAYRNHKSVIVAEGYHRGYGKPHAEVEAIRQAKRRGFKDLSGMTLYVNLEPCCHYGKTPPCTDLIIREKIPHVVFGTTDPNPAVAGKSVSLLRRAGVRVEYGILKKECHEFNRAFFKLIRTGLPWITLKIAQTLDGQIADFSGRADWISSESSRRWVHQMRTEYDAVLVGAGTVMKDNPQLNVRWVKGRPPLRVVVDGALRTSLRSTVYQTCSEQPTVVFTSSTASRSKSQKFTAAGVRVERIESPDAHLPLEAVFRKLVADYLCSSVLVEGGAEIFSQLLETRLADEGVIFIAPKIIGQGLLWTHRLNARALHQPVLLTDIRTEQIGEDVRLTGKWSYSSGTQFTHS